MLAAMPAATLVVSLMFGIFFTFVKAPEMKNKATLLEQLPLVKKSDGFDLKILAGFFLSVEQDLLTDFVLENGFDVTASQTVAAIDVMNRAVKQPEVSAFVAVDAAMPMLRFWLGLPRFGGLAPCVLRPALLKQPLQPLLWLKPPLRASSWLW